jgi:WD40 repeat protein/predicted Ser/Thr protein kinase
LGISPGRQSFADYELLEEIARGGMGVVYKARQRSLGRFVAVKMILSGQFAGKEFVQRFRGEAAAAAILQHPNIVSVHEVGVHEGKHFFSMDYVEGHNLAQLVGNRPLLPQQAARYVKLIAEAVHYAHGQGILHRDLKPSNVLVDLATDQPRVTDFGLAKRLDGNSSLTLTGQVLGSPNFMPPEQADGTRGKVGRHSDVYGLGGILYFLLAARAPFQAESLEAIVTQVIHVEPIAPRLLNPTVPLDLETICLKCLEKEPGKRYGNALELSEDLGHFLKNEPIGARPVSRVERAWRWCRRNPMVASLTGAVTILVIGVAVLSPLAAWRITAARNTARQGLYAADMKLVQQAWESGNARVAMHLLSNQIPWRGQADLRGFEWRYWWQVAQGDQELTFRGHTSAVDFVAFGQDGRTIISHSADGVLNLWDITVPRNTPINTAKFPDSQGGAALSPDRKTLALTHLNQISLLDPDTFRDSGKRIMTDRRLSTQLALSPDHRWLAVSYGDYSLQVWELASGRWHHYRNTGSDVREGLQSVGISSNLVAAGGLHGLLRVWDLRTFPEERDLQVPQSEDSSPISCIAFSGDERVLALATGSAVRLLELSAMKPAFSTLRAASNSDELASLTFSPDGHWLAAGTSSGAIELWDTSKQRLSRVLQGHTARVTSLAFSADSRRLVSGGEDTTVRMWGLEARTERDVVHLATSNLTSAALAPDGKSMALGTSSGTVMVWDSMSRTTPTTLGAHQQAVLSLAYSPDGGTLGSASGGERDESSIGEIRLWNVGSDKFAILPGFTNTASSLAFFPDGQTVALAGPYAPELWDMAIPGEFRIFLGHKARVRVVALAWNGRLLASGSSDASIKLWNPRSKAEPATLVAGSDGVSCLAFSKDGRLLASAGDGLSIRLWDVQTRSFLCTLDGHRVRTISSLAFSPDGKTLVSGGADNTVRLWNVGSQREVATFDTQSTRVIAVLFNDQGTMLSAVSTDGSVRFWPAPGTEARRR